MTGTIGIEADRGNGAFTLAYHDDGVGLPETVVPSPGSTFGMQLIHLLVEQLKGEITITRDGGTRFAFRFPFMEEAAPAV
jgi:two-component sensor histidine kinase